MSSLFRWLICFSTVLSLIGITTVHAETKVGPRIRNLVKELNSHGITVSNAAVLNAARFSNFLARVDNAGWIQTYLHVTSLDEAAESLLLEQGADIEIYNEEMGIVQAWIPFDAVDAIAVLPFISRVTSPSYGRNRFAPCVNAPGGCVTAGDAILRSDELRALGFDGTGIKVGVISDGASKLSQAVNKGELPSGIVSFGTCSGIGAGRFRPLKTVEVNYLKKVTSGR